MEDSTGRIRHLRETLLNRRALVPFSEILRAIVNIDGVGTLKVLVGHPKLTGRPSRVTLGDFLIFERFSFSIEGGELTQLMSIPETDRTDWARSIDQLVTHRTDFVRLHALGTYSHISDDILDLLHHFFVTTEYEKLVAKSAKTIVKSLIAKDKDGAPRYDQLISANRDRFRLESSFFRSSDNQRFNRFLGQYPPSEDPCVHQLELLMKDSVTARQSLNGEITVNGSPVFVRAIPLRKSSSRKIDGCFVLFSVGVPAASFAVAVNELVVDHYNDLRVSGEQATTQTELQLAIIKATLQKRENIEEAKIAFLETVTKRLLKTTHAHSVTIRGYSSFSNSLDLLACTERGNNVSVDVCDAASQDLDSPIKSIDCSAVASVNGFCYNVIADRDAVYIPNIDSIPDEYAFKGLQKVKRCRPGTRSELCVPILSRRMRFGTLNLEAPFEAAFEFDVEYVKGISYLVSQYLDTQGAAQDSWWLSHLSFTHLATHELKDFKLSLNATQQERLERIIYTLSPQSLFSRARSTTLGDIVEQMKQAHLRQSAHVKFDKVWRMVSLDFSRIVSGRFASSLYLILLSVLNNTRHSKYETDSIELELQTANHQADILRISYCSGSAVVDPESIGGMFDVPNINSDGWHFGLFLIGVHSRLLGGHVEVDPDCRKEEDYSKFSFRVNLPIDVE
jgi:hypothetical protein